MSFCEKHRAIFMAGGECDLCAQESPVAYKEVKETLEKREHVYGDYAGQSTITGNIKRAMSLSPNWNRLSDDKREALSMIATKIGRILNGDPDYRDSWHDICGYAKLVADTLDEV